MNNLQKKSPKTQIFFQFSSKKEKKRRTEVAIFGVF